MAPAPANSPMTAKATLAPALAVKPDAWRRVAKTAMGRGTNALAREFAAARAVPWVLRANHLKSF